MANDERPEWITDDSWLERANASEDRSFEEIVQHMGHLKASRYQAVTAASAIMHRLRLVVGYGGIPAVRSPIESIYWLELAGPAFTRSVRVQYEPIGYEPYVPDFELSRGNELLIVELDGHDFHEKSREQAEHDKRRDRWFAAKGLRVIRFTGSEVWRNARACIDEALAFFPPISNEEQ